MRVRPFIENWGHFKTVFSQADIAIMPSITEGLGLAAMEGLSAGLPILVSANSAFGEALRKVPSGSGSVIYSEQPTSGVVENCCWLVPSLVSVLAKKSFIRFAFSKSLTATLPSSLFTSS